MGSGQGSLPPRGERAGELRAAAARMDAAGSLVGREAGAAEDGRVEAEREARGCDVDCVWGIGEAEGQGARPDLGALEAPVSGEEDSEEGEQRHLVGEGRGKSEDCDKGAGHNAARAGQEQAPAHPRAAEEVAVDSIVQATAGEGGGGFAGAVDDVAPRSVHAAYSVNAYAGHKRAGDEEQ